MALKPSSAPPLEILLKFHLIWTTLTLEIDMFNVFIDHRGPQSLLEQP